jgi:phospholipid transport system substrate-binding protein
MGRSRVRRTIPATTRATRAIDWDMGRVRGTATVVRGFGLRGFDLRHGVGFAITVAPRRQIPIKTMHAMPASRRAFLVSLLSAAVAFDRALAAESGGGPTAVIQRFYDTLLAEMKDAKRLSFDQRYQRLAPAVTQTYNLPLMSRLAVGPGWANLQPAQQQAVTDAFSRYTISVYANRFNDYSGERFDVDPNPATSANGLIVQTTLTKSNGEKVSLNYLMRQGEVGWQVIDVYLTGTISQLATQRSEYTAVLQQGGADALVKLLDQRIASLRTG